ncbi:hypothetical protein CC86DRAFT_467766 [Ophiobolus disseminans]|uniref:FAS1 domain-containing protein n=1 Tax=Ophiobolus disseminans TaxID=1469910 RepID=A0A6A6ZXQ2_9PLEO|nr:hypothetical protein CC86DRAFT_467766 [Ophiobolus disseminans]
MRASIPALSILASYATAQTMFLTSLLAGNPDLSSFADALGIPASSFAGSLGRTPVTIFAPTNAAFEAVTPSSPEGTAIRNRDRAAVQALLSYHVLQGTYLLTNFTETPKTVTTISNQTYTIARARGNNIELVFGGSTTTVAVPQGDIQTAGNLTIPNVTVHKISRLISLPANLTANSTATPSASGTASMTTGGTAQSTGGAAKLGAGLGAAMGFGLALVL